jgi:hypothetical protein
MDDREWWRNASPHERMVASAQAQQPADAPPSKRHALYVSPSMLNRPRQPGAWSNRTNFVWGLPRNRSY